MEQPAVPSRQKGFTVVELLVVIVVIAILAVIIIVVYNGMQRRAIESSLQADLRSGSKQIGIYLAGQGQLPVDASGLKVSGNNTYQYDRRSDTSYCLTVTSAKSGVATFHIEDGGAIQQGPCPGHTESIGGSLPEITTSPVTFNPPAGTTTTYPLNIDFQPTDTLLMLSTKRYIGTMTTKVHGNTCTSFYSALLYSGSTVLSACKLTGLTGTGDLEVSIASTTGNSTRLTLIPIRGIPSSSTVITEQAGWGQGPNKVKHTSNPMSIKKGQLAIFAAVTYGSTTLPFPLDPLPATGWNVVHTGFGNDQHSLAYLIPQEDSTVSGSIQGSSNGYYGVTMFVLGGDYNP